MNLLRIVSNALILAAAIAPSAFAAPVTLNQGESVVYNFDASALVPYDKVGFAVDITGFDNLADWVKGTGFRGVDATDGGFMQCISTELSACLDFWSFLFPAGPALGDGSFSLQISAETGSFTVNSVYALVGDVTGGVTRLAAIGSNALPEPATLGLAGLGLLAVAGSRRRSPKRDH